MTQLPTQACHTPLLQQAEHAFLLEQVQALEVLRKENSAMAALVAELAPVRKD